MHPFDARRAPLPRQETGDGLDASAAFAAHASASRGAANRERVDLVLDGLRQVCVFAAGGYVHAQLRRLGMQRERAGAEHRIDADEVDEKIGKTELARQSQAQDIGRESRTHYLLGYDPGEIQADGRFRKIEVRLRRKGLALRARRGYYAPSSTEPVRLFGVPGMSRPVYHITELVADLRLEPVP